MNLLVIFLVLPATLAARLREGDPCNADGKPGVCKVLLDCPYAYKLVTIDEIRPPHCAYVRDSSGVTTEVVCCPTEVFTSSGEFRDTFSGSKDGVLFSNDLSCRYEGEIPFVCCESKPDPPLTVEPRSCPAVDGYTRSDKQRNDLIWNKCLEFQKYHFPCVSTKEDPTKYIRKLECTQNVLGERISEGTPAKPREFPHMALLGCRNVERTEWVGGGSLISDRFILTAAHVLSHNKYGILRYALLGTTSRDPKQGLLYNVIQHIPHSLYDKKEKYNDIALLKLDRQVQMSVFIRPICLPMVNVRIGKHRMVSGWGRTGADQKPSKELLKTNVNILSETECTQKIDSQVFTYGWKQDSMICAGDPGMAGKDTCEGDSGGPLQVYMDDLNCTYIIEGVVSFGPTCGKGHPAVYTNVEFYLPWITNIVWPTE